MYFSKLKNDDMEYGISIEVDTIIAAWFPFFNSAYFAILVCCYLSNFEVGAPAPHIY